jgi:outer membrane protein W
MKIRILLLLGILLYTLSGHTQDKRYQARLSLSDGRAMTGIIIHGEKYITPEQFTFFPNGGDTLILTPEMVYQLEIRGEIKELYTGKLASVAPLTDDLDQLPDSRKIVPEEKWIFMKALVLGDKANLYSYTNPSGYNHYFINKGEIWDELVAFKYYWDDSRYWVARDFRFRNQLQGFFYDCYNVRLDAARSNFKESVLTKLFKAYHYCDGMRAYYQAEEPKIRPYIGLKTGVSFTTMKTDDEAPEEISSINFDYGTNLLLGISLKLVLPKHQRRNSIILEWFSSPFRSASTSTPDRVHLVAYQLNTLYQRRYQLGRLYPYFTTGLRYSRVLQEKAFTPLLDPSIGKVGLVGGIGLNFNRLDVDFRMEMNDLAINFTDRFFPFEQFQTPMSPQSTLSVQISYHLPLYKDYAIK